MNWFFIENWNDKTTNANKIFMVISTTIFNFQKFIEHVSFMHVFADWMSMRMVADECLYGMITASTTH